MSQNTANYNFYNLYHLLYILISYIQFCVKPEAWLFFFIPDVASNNTETPITLTPNTRTIQPSVTQAESGSQSSITLRSEFTNKTLLGSLDENSSTLNSVIVEQTVRQTAQTPATLNSITSEPTLGISADGASTVRQTETTPSTSQQDGLPTTIDDEDNIEPTMTAGSSSSSTPQSTARLNHTQTPSMRSVIDNPPLTVDITSSSLHDNQFVPTSQIVRDTESSFTQVQSLDATLENGVTIYSSVVTESHSTIQSELKLGAGIDFSTLVLQTSSQEISIPDVTSQILGVTSQVLESSSSHPAEDEVKCSDRACLFGMQSTTSTVVFSSEHDISFNTLTTVHASSTSNPEISSELITELNSPTISPTQHDDLQSSSLFMSSANLPEYSTFPNEDQTVLNFARISTIRDSSSVFTDSVNVITASSAEISPASSTTESTFTTLVSQDTTLTQTTAQIDVSTSVSTSTTNVTITDAPPKSTEATSQTTTVVDQNTTITQSKTTTTEQTTTFTTFSTTQSTTTTEAATTAATVNSTLTTQSDVAVTSEKTLNTSDAWADYWVVTGESFILYQHKRKANEM